ncbi:MAG: rRNA synthase, partial [bacterium]
MRLAKFLAHAGVASRRGAEEIIRDRRVTVGDKVVTDPALDVDADSGVAVDGRYLQGVEERMVFVVH